MSDRHDELDDATVEAILRGEAVDPELQPLADAIQALRNAPRPPVKPSPELARRMATGDFDSVSSYDQRKQRGRSAWSALAAYSQRAKIALLLAVGITALGGLAAAGALPDPVQQRVKDIVESITPLEVPGPAKDDVPVDDGDGVQIDESDSGVEIDGSVDDGESGPRQPDENAHGAENDVNDQGNGDGQSQGNSGKHKGSGNKPSKPTPDESTEESPTPTPTADESPSPSPTPSTTPTPATTPTPVSTPSPTVTESPLFGLDL